MQSLSGEDMSGASLSANIAVLNVHYSANLGDGLLSTCLMDCVANADPAMTLTPIDLAARTDISTLGKNWRGIILRSLSKLPITLRNAFIGLVLDLSKKRKWLPFYQSHLSRADAVILGGGNLIVDQDLNFPVKINSALAVAASYDLPVHIYGVGVGEAFSETGKSMLLEAFRKADLRSVCVRDNASKQNWDHHFADACGLEAEIVWDPGLACQMVWPDPAPFPSGSVDVAIGVMSPQELIYHEPSSVGLDLAKWYVELIQTIQNAGLSVRLFSNGSPEDTRFLRRQVLPNFPGTEVVIPTTPAELAQTIYYAQIVVAFRMHALIPAFAYGNSVLALEWDHKIRSLMDRFGQIERCVNVRSVSGSNAAELCLSLKDEPQLTTPFAETIETELRALAVRVRQSLPGSDGR